MKNVECKHFKKERGSVYIYNLIGQYLYLCKKCAKKLRKQILEQNKFEETLKKHG